MLKGGQSRLGSMATTKSDTSCSLCCCSLAAPHGALLLVQVRAKAWEASGGRSTAGGLWVGWQEHMHGGGSAPGRAKEQRYARLGHPVC